MQTNELREFASRGIVKGVTFFFLFLSIALFSIFIMSAVMLANHNAYSIDGPGYLEGIVDTLLVRDAESIAKRLDFNEKAWYENEEQRALLQTELEKSFDSSDSNLRFAVFKVDTEELLLHSEDAADLHINNARYSTVYTARTKDDIRICLYLRTGSSVVDKYTITEKFFGILGRNRYLVLLIVALSFLAAVLLLNVMLLGIGRRPGSNVCVLHTWDRIPLEIYLFCAGITLAFPSLLIVRIEDLSITYQYDQLFRVAFDAMGIVYWSLVGYFVIMTVARRIKAKRLYKTTYLYRLVQTLSRLLCQEEWGVRFYFRFLLFYLVLSAAELIAMQVFEHTNLILIWIAEKLLICHVAAVVVYNLSVLEQEGKRLKNGDASQRVHTEKLLPFFRHHGDTLNEISKGMRRTVDEQMRSERMKAELITNVSHDLKTPLTSIVNYVDLIEKAGLDSPQAPEYFDVVNRQAVRLKKLVLDLVEASKAASGSTPVELETLDLNLMLSQATGEYAERMREHGLDQVVALTDKPLLIRADPKHLWRVFDNLLGNATLYSQTDSRVYITTHTENENAVVIFRNISKQRLNISADELMERFVRGDSSRNTEGSGLGLSIAKDLTTLQGGHFKLVIDGDLFKAIMTFPLVEDESEEL